MEKKLFVGNLAYSVTDTQLQKLFEPHGIVKSVKVISDKTTGRSRGYGFVEMSSKDEARRAIEALNGTQLEGRALIINERVSSRRTATGIGTQTRIRPIQRIHRELGKTGVT